MLLFQVITFSLREVETLKFCKKWHGKGLGRLKNEPPPRRVVNLEIKTAQESAAHHVARLAAGARVCGDAVVVLRSEVNNFE